MEEHKLADFDLQYVTDVYCTLLVLLEERPGWVAAASLSHNPERLMQVAITLAERGFFDRQGYCRLEVNKDCTKLRYISDLALGL